RLNLEVVHVLEKPKDGWKGERGYINAAVLSRHLPPPFTNHEYFICGPDVMMDAIEGALSNLDVPMSKYHSERYSFAWEASMRRIFADWLAFGTGIVVIAMSVLFAVLRSGR